MKYLSLFLILIVCKVEAQEKLIKPMFISSKLGIIPFNLGFISEASFHINQTNAVGFEANFFCSEPQIKKPSSGGSGPSFLFATYTEYSQSYRVKYTYSLINDKPSYFQIGLSTAIGIHQLDRIIGYNKNTSGGFLSFTYYDEIYRREAKVTYQFGFQIVKRKSIIDYFASLDFQLSEHKSLLLFKTGLQINIFKKDKSEVFL